MRFRFLLPYLVAIFLVSSAFFVSFPFKTKASSLSDIAITMSPENPVPNENVTIALSSYVDDLNSVLISWSVDGKKVLSGIDDISLPVTAPALGGTETVVATISLPDGDLNETVTIKPSIMVMLWQAEDSYVPPFL